MQYEFGRSWLIDQEHSYSFFNVSIQLRGSDRDVCQSEMVLVRQE